MDQAEKNRTDAQLQAMLRAEILELRTELAQREAEISALLRQSETEAINRVVESELHGTVQRWFLMRVRRIRHRLAQRKHSAALSESPLFDSDWYFEHYPECGKPKKAIAHYLKEGAFSGNNPGPEFDTSAYYHANPDVAAGGWPALAHYVLHGCSEGRHQGLVTGD